MNTLPKRKPTRLKNYDYSQQGTVFITICTHNKKRIFSKIEKDKTTSECILSLSEYGRIAEYFISHLPEKYPNFSVDTFIIMPDHIHFILTKEKAAPDNINISQVVAWLKYNITSEINKTRSTQGQKIFQRSFYDHIIINEKDYEKHWNYIYGNPFRWNNEVYLVYAENK